MPDKPTWYSRLPTILEELSAAPTPWIDAALLQTVLEVSHRRAQQILRPLVRHTLGRNGLAAKTELIEHLRALAAGTEGEFEQQRRRRFEELLKEAHQVIRRQPPVLVEAPPTIVYQDVQRLPKGIHLSPGQIVIDQFRTADEAKQLLLALILAIGNDSDEFDTQIAIKNKTHR